MTTVHPTSNRVVVKRDEPRRVTECGIIVPDAARRKGIGLVSGVVKRVGPGKRDPKNPALRIAMATKPGDRVLFPPWEDGLADVDIDGEECIILSEDVIQAVDTGDDL